MLDLLYTLVLFCMSMVFTITVAALFGKQCSCAESITNAILVLGVCANNFHGPISVNKTRNHLINGDQEMKNLDERGNRIQIWSILLFDESAKLLVINL